MNVSSKNYHKIESIKLLSESIKKSELGPISKIKDKLDTSVSLKVFNKVDAILNLGKSDRLEINDLTTTEKAELFKVLNTLFKNGIIGYEVLEINNKPEKHFIDTQIGNTRTYNAKLYKKKSGKI